MLDATTYAKKLENHERHTVLPHLEPRQRQAVRSLASKHRFTFQELREGSEAALDLRMWQETPLKRWWQWQVRDGHLACAIRLSSTGPQRHPLRPRAGQCSYFRGKFSWVPSSWLVLKSNTKSSPTNGLSAL